MENPKEKTIVMLNASALKESSCGLRLFNTVVGGYRDKINSNDVEWGSAFHKFRAIFKAKGTEGFPEGVHVASKHFDDAVMHIKNRKKYLTTAYLQKACIDYATTYQNDENKIIRNKNGEPLVEVPFCFPFYSNEWVDVLIAGTIDSIEKQDGGINLICDCKTTSMWDRQAYFKSFELSCQLLNYTWALHKFAEAFPDSIIADIVKQGVGCIIDGVFHNGESKGVEFARSNVFMFTEKDFEEFEIMLKIKVGELIADILAWKQTGKLPYRSGILNGACNTIYGLCKFSLACSQSNLEVRKTIMEQNFKQEIYNPLKQIV